ncbi:unnamed protein product [Thelazia callipaeda]|uniref:Telomere_reg-2 domain-containing protein n=1 Tax=Thelazia callipaeda TaxID=103827 RepID=A0A158RBE0_THECL|nr:unnamed protein product [Thelazia callipaeda]
MKFSEVLDMLKKATGRAELLSSLQIVRNCITSFEWSSSEKCRILATLLNMLQPAKFGLLTASEFKDMFGAIFHSAAVDDAIIVLINALNSCSDSELFRLQRIVILLDELEKNNLETLLVTSIKKSLFDAEWNAKEGELCRLIGQTTCLVHNAMGSSLSSSGSKQSDMCIKAYLNNHWIYLLQSVKSAIEKSFKEFENAEDVNFKFVTDIIYEISRGNVDTFRTLINWLGLHAKSPDWSKMCSKLLTDTTNGMSQLESLLMATLLAAKDGELLFFLYYIKMLNNLIFHTLFGNEILENRIVKRVFFEKALFVKVFHPKEEIPKKLSLCLQVGNKDTDDKGPWSTLHRNTILTTFEVWSSSIHVTHSSDEQMDYIDLVLLKLVKHANQKMRLGLSSEVCMMLATGVDIRLRSSNNRRRFRGMYVAETISKWFSLGKLEFEFPSEGLEFIQDMIKEVQGDECTIDHKVLKDESENADTSKNLVQVEVHDTLNGTGDVDSDDDDFPEYNIPFGEMHLEKEQEDEEYHNVKGPHYIKDCIEGLNEETDHVKFEAAFNALDSMIRRRAIGYEQLANDLLSRLLTLPNRFSTPNFHEKRLHLIKLCLSTSPHLGSVAVDFMYSRQCAMTNRYVIIRAISEVASEFSSMGSVIEDNCKEIKKDTDNVRDKKLASKTRRFGQSRTVVARPNKFTILANSFFYPLVAINHHREHLNLIGRDSELLSRILVCIANLIKCSGNASCTLKMVDTMLHILLPLRHHENSAVRQAVLFCYATICVSLSEEIILEHYREELFDCLDYATNLAQFDPSLECRQMALLAAQLANKVISDKNDFGLVKELDCSLQWINS